MMSRTWIGHAVAASALVEIVAATLYAARPGPGYPANR
jgi:hypothetical protein